jgi:hypothetical protein
LNKLTSLQPEPTARGFKPVPLPTDLTHEVTLSQFDPNFISEDSIAAVKEFFGFVSTDLDSSTVRMVDRLGPKRPITVLVTSITAHYLRPPPSTENDTNTKE